MAKMHVIFAEQKESTMCCAGILSSIGRPTGQSIKWLSIVDEYTRRCIALDVSKSISSEDIINRLSELFVIYGQPKHIRSDNGPEFIAHAIRDWVRKVGIGTLYVEPGSPLGK